MKGVKQCAVASELRLRPNEETGGLSGVENRSFGSECSRNSWKRS